jgi:2-dehydro-3-deoxyphosphogluconate aldolase / (4S)-4-hydroxy-2-oxoglutarate aldolase
MDKHTIKEKLKNKIISVIRCEDSTTAKLISKTVIESGIDVLEITFTVKGAAELIKELKAEYPQAIIGAGTVLTIDQAKVALDNGADFIVSPCTIEEIGVFCRENKVFCSMGAATPTEAYNSYKYGSDVVKLFPGEIINPGIIKAIKAPMPFIDMMPTGGVDNTNIKKWFEKGAFAVGVGGHLTGGINESNLELLRERCETLIKASREN